MNADSSELGFCFPRGCGGAEGPASPCWPQRVGSPPAGPDPVSASLPRSASGAVMPWAGRWPCSGCISSHPCEIPSSTEPGACCAEHSPGQSSRLAAWLHHLRCEHRGRASPKQSRAQPGRGGCWRAVAGPSRGCQLSTVPLPAFFILVVPSCRSLHAGASTTAFCHVFWAVNRGAGRQHKNKSVKTVVFYFIVVKA